ncbi:MAG: hypothetical protein ACTSW4_02795 [Candidatus Ranarchaeia archaeon]
MSSYALLQLTGCSGCEVSLLNADEWIEKNTLEQFQYMPFVIASHHMPKVDLLFVTGAIRTEDDRRRLIVASRRAKKVVAVGTCAVTGGVTHLSDQAKVKNLLRKKGLTMLEPSEKKDTLVTRRRTHVDLSYEVLSEVSRPSIISDQAPIDTVIDVSVYLPGCPPTPNLFVSLLESPPDKLPRFRGNVCSQCRRRTDRSLRPNKIRSPELGGILTDICLRSQGFLCLGPVTHSGCGALCVNTGNPCVGCRGPIGRLIEDTSGEWIELMAKIFSRESDITRDMILREVAQLPYALFLPLYTVTAGKRTKENVV